MNPPRSAPSILVRGVNWLGDAVMTTPALLRLREARPDARITLLTLDSIADLWRHFPALDSVLSFSRGEPLFKLAQRLRRERFDTALVLPNSARSALEPFLARIPVRIGYPRGLPGLLLNQRMPRPASFVPMRKKSTAEIKRLLQTSPSPQREIPPSSAHHVHHYLHLAAALGANPVPVPPRLHVTDDELNAFKTRFHLKETTAPLFAINPGAAYGLAKCWPLQRFVETAVEVRQQTGCRWLILGGGNDVDNAATIESSLNQANPALHPPPVNLAGKTNLRELSAALKLSQLLLSNDSGPMHLAAALGARVVVPFGSTSPELTRPGLPSDSRHSFLVGTAPCAPCFLRSCPIDHRCMTSITVHQVVQACASPLT